MRLASWSSRPQVAGYALLPAFFGGLKSVEFF